MKNHVRNIYSTSFYELHKTYLLLIWFHVCILISYKKFINTHITSQNGKWVFLENKHNANRNFLETQLNSIFDEFSWTYLQYNSRNSCFPKMLGVSAFYSTCDVFNGVSLQTLLYNAGPGEVMAEVCFTD